MANELIVHYPGDNTLYALLMNATGSIWNGSTFETPVDANWANYDIAMTEAQNTGIYRGTMPSVASGIYTFAIRDQAGGSPAITDPAVAMGSIDWTGTAEVSLGSGVTLADSAISASTITDGSFTAAKFAIDACNKIADHILRRSSQNAEDSSFGDTKGFRSLLGAVAKLTHKIAPDAGGNLEVFESDDTTLLGEQYMTTDSGADPITGLDTV